MALGLSPTEIVAKSEYQLLTAADHWERVLLSDIADAQNGFAFKSGFFDREKGVPLIRIRDISSPETEHRYFGEYHVEYVVRSGDILIGMDGDFTAARWRGGDALLNQRVCRLALTSDLFDERFFFLCLQPYLDAINAETSSVTVKHLSSKTVQSIPLPLPPLAEQRRLVAKIEELFSELDKGLESLQTAREQLEVYGQAVLKQAFEGKLTASWREKYAGSVETVGERLCRMVQLRESRERDDLAGWKQLVRAWEERGERGPKPSRPSRFKPPEPIDPTELDNLPGVPESWRYVRLAEIAKIGTGMSVSSRRKVADPIEVPYLRVANVQRGHLDLDEIKTMTIERSHLPRLELASWDVLFNEGGDRDKLGRGWVWNSQIEPCITQNHVFRARPLLLSELHSKWISYWGNSFGRRYFERQGKQTTNLASINKTVLSRFPVPLPPIQEQEEIVQTLEARSTVVDRLEEEIESSLGRLMALRQAILKRAFEGRLVPQDTIDESASLLLARIAAEREERSSNSTKRKTGT